MDKDNKLVFELLEKTNLHISSSSTSNDNLESSSDTVSIPSSSSEEDDILLFPLLKYITTGRKKHRVENYLQVVDSWINEEFKEHLRIKRCVALKLIDELEQSGFMPSHCFGIKPISAKLSFLLFLWYIANTEPLRTMADRFDVSILSVFRILRRVIAWLLTKLETSIRWPQGHAVLVTCEQFFKKQGIPNVLGAIDGTTICIEKPAGDAQDYCNRKKFFSISLQAVADANMKFTNIYYGEPGSLHDARVFRRSPLYETVSINETLFPNNTFLLGDSAYPSLPWLVPPFRDNGHLTDQQIEFNYIHSSTRMSIERAFGLLKGRFRRIKFFTEYRDLSFITDTVAAACILHNYCIDEDDFCEFSEINDDFEDTLNDNIETEEFNNTLGIDHRMELFQEMFPH